MGQQGHQNNGETMSIKFTSGGNPLLRRLGVDHGVILLNDEICSELIITEQGLLDALDLLSNARRLGAEVLANFASHVIRQRKLVTNLNDFVVHVHRFRFEQTQTLHGLVRFTEGHQFSFLELHFSEVIRSVLHGLSVISELVVRRGMSPIAGILLLQQVVEAGLPAEEEADDPLNVRHPLPEPQEPPRSRELDQLLDQLVQQSNKD